MTKDNLKYLNIVLDYDIVIIQQKNGNVYCQQQQKIFIIWVNILLFCYNV